jgi:aspartate/methionine/tyrosine aminotransferase
MPPDEFHRIRRLPPYVLAEVNTAKVCARTAREDIIDLGMGNPDSPTPPHVVAKLSSMFAWAPVPSRFAQLGSVEFSKLLLARAKLAVAPGLGFGEHGEGFVRIALVENTHRLRQSARNIRVFLAAGSKQAPASPEAIAADTIAADASA